MANFDKPINNNVSIPFASGCQCVWTIPYKEKFNQKAKAIVGGIDPAIRKYIEPETLLFSMPSDRFVELSQKASNSFLQNNSWQDLINLKNGKQTVASDAAAFGA